MFISVDLPAPFSPSSAWISPGAGRSPRRGAPGRRRTLDDPAHGEQRRTASTGAFIAASRGSMTGPTRRRARSHRTNVLRPNRSSSAHRRQSQPRRLPSYGGDFLPLAPSRLTCQPSTREGSRNRFPRRRRASARQTVPGDGEPRGLPPLGGRDSFGPNVGAYSRTGAWKSGRKRMLDVAAEGRVSDVLTKLGEALAGGDVNRAVALFRTTATGATSSPSPGTSRRWRARTRCERCSKRSFPR